MSKSKSYRLEVNDVFDELKSENLKLNKQIVFIKNFIHLLDKFRDNLNDFYKCCKCEHNVNNQKVFNDLQNQYQTLSDNFGSVIKSDPQLEQTNTIFNDRSGQIERPLLMVTRKMITKSIKREITSESENEDFNDNNNGFDNNPSDDENYNQNEEISEPFDSSSYLNNDSTSEFIKKKRSTYSTENLACNFSGCSFECLNQPRMQRHIETYHLSKTPEKCEECQQICWTKYQLGNHIKREHKHLYDNNSKKFICTFIGCKTKLQKWSQLVRHRLRHTGEKTFICARMFPGCEWTFFTSGELRNHQVAVHSVPEHYCDWIGCGQGFKVKSDLDLHKLHKHSDSEVPKLELLETIMDPFNNFVPDRTHLKKDFDSNYCVVKHLNTNKIRYYICNYNDCDFKCSVGTKMENHIKQLHFNKSPVKCLECSEMFWSQKSLTNHIRPKHPNLYDQSTQMFRCNYEECDLSFDRFSKLLVHQRRHTGMKAFKCSDEYPNCPWSFFTVGELRNHQVWAHSGQYPFACDWDGCDKRFKLKNLLADHKLKHTPEAMPFRCEWPGCENRFVRKTSLRVHMESHVGAKDFLCDWPECGHTFRNKSNLTAHYAIHTNDRRHRCEWPGCEARFISTTALNRHKMVHDSVQRYQCCWPHCEKRFKAKSSLKIHTMGHRGEKPFACEAIDCNMRFVEKKQMKKHFKRRHLPKF